MRLVSGKSLLAQYLFVNILIITIIVQILNLPPINIYQESPTEDCACDNNGQQVFNKGKSCLFALPGVILSKQLCSFPITMTVYKELPPGVLPDVMLIGPIISEKKHAHILQHIFIIVTVIIIFVLHSS